MSLPLPRSSPPLFPWAALLGFALFAPAALPAGGAERRLPELKRRESAEEPLLSSFRCSLHCSPLRQAPVLVDLAPDMPLRVLRTWLEPGGCRWIQVATVAPTGRPTRGWLMG